MLELPPEAVEPPMLISEPLAFVKEFIDALDTALKAHQPLGPGLSFAQRHWLRFCLMAILITNSVCWARFEQASLGRYSRAALSWMFRHAKISWDRHKWSYCRAPI